MIEFLNKPIGRLNYFLWFLVVSLAGFYVTIKVPSVADGTNLTLLLVITAVVTLMQLSLAYKRLIDFTTRERALLWLLIPLVLQVYSLIIMPQFKEYMDQITIMMEVPGNEAALPDALKVHVALLGILGMANFILMLFLFFKRGRVTPQE